MNADSGSARAARLAARPTADGCVEIIKVSLERRDWQGVEAGLRALVVVDPRKAADVYDTMRVGLMLAGGGGRD